MGKVVFAFVIVPVTGGPSVAPAGGAPIEERNAPSNTKMTASAGARRARPAITSQTPPRELQSLASSSHSIASCGRLARRLADPAEDGSHPVMPGIGRVTGIRL